LPDDSTEYLLVVAAERPPRSSRVQLLIAQFLPYSLDGAGVLPGHLLKYGNVVYMKCGKFIGLPNIMQ
jgi:hypothetical protein